MSSCASEPEVKSHLVQPRRRRRRRRRKVYSKLTQSTRRTPSATALPRCRRFIRIHPALSTLSQPELSSVLGGRALSQSGTADTGVATLSVSMAWLSSKVVFTRRGTKSYWVTTDRLPS
jgi:hypothetical protein